MFFWAWRLWKFIIHFLTGRCELERICESNISNIKKTIKLERSLKNSKLVQSTPLLSTSLLPEVSISCDVANVTNILIKMKCVADKKIKLVRRELECGIKTMRSLSLLVVQLERDRKTRYDSNNEDHETILLQLWELLRPGVRLTQRKTKEWGEIGFQGDDPATDFRGMGFLGLQCMVQFARTFPLDAKKILSDSTRSNWFPWAITSITISSDILNLTKKRFLAGYYYEHGCTMESFFRLHGRFFIRFNEAWNNANPENVMAFSAIHDAFLKEMVKRARSNESF